MKSENFVLTVLPLTTKAGAHHHVSLHIAPRLTPNGAQEPLDSFTLFRDWAKVVAGASFKLLSQSGAVIAAQPLLDAIQPGNWAQGPDDLWRRVLPPTLTVRNPNFNSFANRQWRSFPVKTVHDLAALVPLTATMLWPLDPPDFKPVSRGREQVGSFLKPLEDGPGLTKLLDATTANEGDSALMKVLRPLHAARRFYDRPEAQRAYGERPIPGKTEPKLAIPQPDFHERVAHLADQPALLRMLGLVIDVRVTDLAALKAATQLSATFTLSGAAVTVIAARTPVKAAAQDRLLTVPRTGEWTDGRLPLGDADRFAALAMDSDGGALKLEQYIRSLPDIYGIAANNDAGNAAPPAMRSEGLTVVRTGRVDVVKAQVATAAAMVAAKSAAPVIATEDVTRGFRVEIWDDTAKAWFSPHKRLSTVRLAGGAAPVVYQDKPELGAVQTAAVNESAPNGPVYLHEALFGWSGWSLSAPRPGPRAEPFHEKDADGIVRQKERAGDGPDPLNPGERASPVLLQTRVAPGTLPRLRYGRDYAFRAWSVDLAGNSPGDPVALAPASPAIGPTGAPTGGAAVATAVAPASATATATAFSADRVQAAMSGLNLARVPIPAARAFPQAHALAVRLAGPPAPEPLDMLKRGLPATARPFAATGIAAVDQLASARLATRAAIVPPAIQSLADSAMLRQSLQTISVEPAQANRAGMLAAMLTADVKIGAALDPGVAIPQLDKTVTPLVPFRRWDPVPPPALVARHRFSPAESIHHLVIRSGVTATDGPDGGQATEVVAPAVYIAAVGAATAADWRATSERHLAAPKGSMVLNELHGRFDKAADAGQAGADALLAAALRDDGTFFDRKIYDLANPAVKQDQPGTTLERGPEITEPMVTLDQIDAHRGDPPPPGYYVVHDVDALALPYLPDPMAAGVAFGMSGANRGSPLVGPFRVESTAARFSGAWPAPEPLRLVLAGDGDPDARVDGRTITITLPPGTRLDMRLSSSLNRADLTVFALWNLMPKALTDLDLWARPAADGQFWSLTPFETISLVHAVPRPVLPPVTTLLLPVRTAGDTGAGFGGVIDLHAPSTDRIDAEASWDEWVDDLASDGPVREARAAVPFHAQVDPDEDMVLLGLADSTGALPGVGAIRVHKARHEFGDTRYRRIAYRFRATTRFREYFPPALLDKPEDRSVVGPDTTLTIPSSAPPPAPVVDSVIPIFRWDETVDPGQPFGVRRRRRSGLRVYVRRPWYRTGDDEQLGVVLVSGGEQQGIHGSVWGSDPIWFNAGPASQLVGLSVEDLYGSVGVDRVRGPDPRLSPPASVTQRGVTLSVLGYRPEYNPDRKLWFFDVDIDPAAAYLPFVRLAVARYQPHSLPGLELSPVVLCDFAQLPPDRTLTLSRPDAGSVRVTVTGAIGARDSLRPPPPPSPVGVANPSPTAPAADDPGYPLGPKDPTYAVAKDRRLWAMLEHRAPGLTSDLDWTRVERVELTVGGVSPDLDFAWTGIVPLDTPLAAAEPGGNRDWRITVVEEETMESDPASLDTTGPLLRQTRIVYADRVVL